jgi:predicted nucleic acid-binding protein
VPDDRWQRVKELMGAALERPAEARQAYLREACGSDERLRREVESLLAARGQAGDFLSEPADTASSAHLATGTRLGPYEIVSFLVAGHSLAELYAMLSSYPTRPRLTPGVATRLVHENVATVAHVVPSTAADYASVVRTVAELGLSGGVVYDALVAQAARKANAERLLTLNVRDFLRVWPEGAGIVVAP